MGPGQRAANDDALNGLSPIQPRTTQGGIQRHHPQRQNLQDEGRRLVPRQIVHNQAGPQSRQSVWQGEFDGQICLPSFPGGAIELCLKLRLQLSASPGAFVFSEHLFQLSHEPWTQDRVGSMGHAFCTQQPGCRLKQRQEFGRASAHILVRDCRGLALALPALTRLWNRLIRAGSGGIAVGVHTTQFAIRKPQIGLYQPVLELAAETARAAGMQKNADGNGATLTEPVLIAGVMGPTAQASTEARLARDLGYDAVLLSLGGLDDWSDAALLAHCREVADIMPVIGFYLQSAVGGRKLSYTFWRAFAEIEQVIGIKIAPFNRYQTLDVMRGVADSGRSAEITLFTGNDDSIIMDLVTPYLFASSNANGTQWEETRMVGGLLGHWAVWTRQSVLLTQQMRQLARTNAPVPQDVLVIANQVTECNAAFFDVQHDFAGCIAGIHAVLRRQGLLAGIWCLDPHETLSPGQMDEIDRVYQAYPHLNDDAFVAEYLDAWLR